MTVDLLDDLNERFRSKARAHDDLALLDDKFGRASSFQDPLADLNDKFGPPAKRKGRERDERTTDEKLHDLTTELSPAPQEKNMFAEAASNVLPDIQHMVGGLTKFGVATMEAGVDTVRMGFNALTGDKEDMGEIVERQKGRGKAIVEAGKSELSRLNEVWGTKGLLGGNTENLEAQFRTSPVGTLLDASAIVDLPAAGLRLAAGRARSTAMRAMAPEFQALKESGQMARAAEVAAPSLQLSRNLDKAASAIESASPIRLMTRTIGAMPPMNKLKGIWQNKIAYMNVVAHNARDYFGLLEDGMAVIEKSGLKNATVADIEAVMPVVQGLKRRSVLTDTQNELARGMREIGRSQRKYLKAADAKFTDEMMDELEMSAALSSHFEIPLGEARQWIKADNKVLDKRIKGLQAELRADQKNLRSMTAAMKGEQGAKAAQKVGRLRKIEADARAQLNKAYEIRKAKDVLSDKLAAGELGFVPGLLKKDGVRLTTPGMSDDLMDTVAQMHGIGTPGSAHMLRKMTVNSDPLSVENAYAQYVANVARMVGRRALLQAAKNEKFLIPLDRGGIKDVVKGMSHRPYEGRTAAGFELIEFEGKEWAVPKGVAKMLRDTINPKPLVSGDAARAMLDTFDASTRMFRKMALAYSPTWIMNNVLGNTALYALGGGSPKELARMLGLKVGSDLEKWMLEHGKTPGKLVSKLAEEYRELIPNTVVRGLIDVDVNMRNLHNTVGPEYYTRAEETWWQQGKMRLNAMARDTVGRVPGARKAADVVGAGLMPYQNFIEEWFRGAMWLTKAQRTARSELMLGVADKTVLLNSADWRMRVKALADEFTGIQTSNTPGGGFKPSPISEAARETLGEVNKWLNDYYRLSPFERNVLRRAVPFYSWMKFTNRLAVQLPYNHPIRMSVAAHTSNVMNDALSLGEVLPDWLKDAISAGENPDGTTTFRSQSGSKETSEGQVTFRGGKGVNVFQGILLGNEGLQTAWQGLNPVLLVPFEWTFGYDTFRQQPFRVADTRAAKQNIARDYQSGESFKVGPDGKMEPYTPRPTIPLAIARSGFVPHFGQMERVIRGGAHDDVGSISELAFEIGRLTAGEPRTYPGVFMDSDSGEPLAPATPGDAAMSVLGMGTKKVNVGEAVEREKKKRVLALQRLKTAKKRERSEIENWLEDLQVDSDAF